MDALHAALDILVSDRLTLAQLQRALGLLIWQAAPSDTILPFAGPLYHVLVRHQGEHPNTRVTVPPEALDLLLQCMPVLQAEPEMDVAPRALEHSASLQPSAISPAGSPGDDDDDKQYSLTPGWCGSSLACS
eukprot:gene3767-4169_t